MSASDFVARGFTPKEATALVRALAPGPKPGDPLEQGELLFFNRDKNIGFIRPKGETRRDRNLLCHVSAFVGGNVPKDGTAVTYNRGMFNHQPVARNVVPTPKEPKKKPEKKAEKKDDKRKDEKKKPAAKEPKDHDPNRPSTDDPVLELGAVGRRPPPGAWQRPAPAAAPGYNMF